VEHQPGFAGVGPHNQFGRQCVKAAKHGGSFSNRGCRCFDGSFGTADPEFCRASECRPRISVGQHIIDDRLARLVWPNQSAIGKRFRFPGPGSAWTEVVGVVGHIRHDGLGIDQRPQVYWSYHQRSQPRMALAVRTNQDPNRLAAGVIAAFQEIDPEQPVYDIRPLNEVVERSLSPQWLNMSLLTLFASVALVLATVGVYGVLSYSVGLRTREIGIRMALGSRRSEVIWMVLRHGGLLAGVGIVIGISGALLVSRILATLVYQVTPRDVLSFISAPLVLLIVALAASYIPARRAAGVDPMSILRME
jgi:predicted permease